MIDIVHNLPDLGEWADRYIINLPQADSSATVVTLSGDLGAGKTSLVKEVAAHLDITEDITSPTFVIMKAYPVVNHNWIKRLVHIDAYRLDGKAELEHLGWDDIISDPGTLVCLEWPEMVEGITMPRQVTITITIGEDDTRTLSIQEG